MGLFSYTCGLSGLPIEGGEPVKYLLLQESTPEVGRGIDVLWVPRTLPITAKYNSYGSIKGFLEDDLPSVWLETLSRDLIELEQGENEYHDVPVYNGMSFRDFLTALWERRVFARDLVERDTRCEVLPIMIREDVWNLLASIDSRVPSEAVKNAWESAKFLAVPDPLPKGTDVDTALEWARNAAFETRELTSLFGYGLSNVSDVFRAMAGRNLSQESEDRFLKSTLEFLRINRALMTLGWNWNPSFASGPQFGEWDTHAAVLSALASIALKHNNNYDDDDIDEED